MFRTVCSVCYLFLTILFCAPAFGENAPKPSEAEIKAMSDKLVGRFYFFSQIKKEIDQIDIDETKALLYQKDFEKLTKELDDLNIRREEINLKGMKYFNENQNIVKQSVKLGDLYSKAGNIEKACEHWKEGREFALKLGFSAKADEINGKLAACQNKAP